MDQPLSLWVLFWGPRGQWKNPLQIFQLIYVHPRRVSAMFEQIRNISPLGRTRSKAKLCKRAIYNLLQFMLLGGNTHICHYAPNCLRWRRNAGMQCVIRTEPVADLRGAGDEHPTPAPSRSNFFSILCQNNTTFGVDSPLEIPRSATGNWSFCPCFLGLCVSLCPACWSICLSALPGQFKDLLCIWSCSNEQRLSLQNYSHLNFP